jgi:hypothetical protein
MLQALTHLLPSAVSDLALLQLLDKSCHMIHVYAARLLSVSKCNRTSVAPPYGHCWHVPL